MASIKDWMMLKEMMGSSSFIEQIREYEKWKKELEEDKKKADADKKLKERPKPPTFSVVQVFLILTGLGPFVGLLAAKLQLELVQQVLDAVRAVH